MGLVLALALGVMGCSEGPGMSGCESAKDCDDQNECTEDSCNPVNGSCEFAALPGGSICEAGACRNGDCEPITSIFPCTEQGIRNAIDVGGGPHAFACKELTTVTTAEGTIIIDNDVILDGLDALEVEAGSALPRRVFLIEEGVNAELRRLAVTGGSVGASGQGGGIWNRGSATLVRCRVFENSSDFFGGGISSGDGLARLEAELTVIDSIVSGNSAETGGGIVSWGTLTVVGTTVSGNSAFTVGGIGSSGTGSVRNSTVSNNTAELGAGIWNEHGGMLTVTNSTVSGNSASIGGGLFNLGTSTVVNSTLVDNSATQEGSAIADDQQEGATVTLSGSLIEGGCSAAIVSSGYNIESPGNTCGFHQPTDQVNVSADDVKLGPLQDVGGPSETLALGAGSVALDVIPEAECVDTEGAQLTTDQRGEPRGSMCDVGAFEVQP